MFSCSRLVEDVERISSFARGELIVLQNPLNRVDWTEALRRSFVGAC